MPAVASKATGAGTIQHPDRDDPITFWLENYVRLFERSFNLQGISKPYFDANSIEILSVWRTPDGL
jgi:hypothetical protein